MQKSRETKIIVAVIIACIICVVGIFVWLINVFGSKKIVDGSEKTYHGIVTDCGMSVVNEGDYKGRPYIVIATEKDVELCFWFTDSCEYGAGIGSTVIIESAIEEETNLLVATKVTVEDSFMGFRKGDFTVVEENDTHGGFHGDGTYLLVLDCSEKKELAMELVKGWKEFPLSENLNTVLYGGANSGSLLLEDEGSIPKITNGYYYFCDRNAKSIDSSDDTDLFSRSSYNFTLAIYDSDTNRFYYMEFDT